MFKKIEFIIGFLMLGYAVWFNLDLYKLEPTATTDPNDNNFQYGLVDRANQIWDYATNECQKQIFFVKPLCHLSIMIDHWVPNWAQGYNLPFYYSHVPQIVIVGSYKLFNTLGLVSNFSLFKYYHLLIYLLLCLFPISMFLGIRVIRLPWVIAGVGALVATQISTDGLYGLDPPSFLWRGWGLSSQLYAMMFLPLAIAYSWRFLTESKGINRESWSINIKTVIRNSLFLIHDSNLWLAIIFSILTTMGHLGIGIVVFLSMGIMAIAPAFQLIISQEKISRIIDDIVYRLFLLALLAGISLFFLSYWVLPTFLSNNFHNISTWDPVWKFDSYGWKETLIRFTNGDLLDFGRFPILTIITLIGIFAAPFISSVKASALNIKEKTMNSTNNHRQLSTNEPTSYFSFSLLFAFWIIIYFGRTTWGKLIDLIPGMTEYHLSRFIVGVHAISMFLIPIGIWWTSLAVADFIRRFFITKKQADNSPIPMWLVTCVLGIALAIALPPVYKQTAYYNELNNRLIVQANTNALKIRGDINLLENFLHTLPSGRIFAGRGGGWGKNFRIAETEMFMHLSTFGFNTVLWLPETWSPNSDTEQYFSEDQAKDYDLYNIRYVVAPPDQTTQPFWKESKRGENWVVYDVPTTGYFTVATRSMVVISDKQSFINLVRLWIQSKIPTQKLYPEIKIGKTWTSDRFKIPTIKMIDEVTYLTAQNTRQNIFAINPIYAGDAPNASLIGPEQVTSDMIFKTTVRTEPGCRECLVVLKQTYHPNWRATVDGKSVKPINVFPSFVAIPISTSGTHELIVWYQPSDMKVFLMVLGLLVSVILVGYFCYPKILLLAKRVQKK
jgi:hypothetical protein